MSNLVHDLLDLPEAVRKGDFVQGLTDGIAKPEATLRDYAITPKIVQSFAKALSILKSALDDNRSQAAYLDGSVGSGKSHFMAVLALMLAGDPTPWRRPELHALRMPHPWIGRPTLHSCLRREFPLGIDGLDVVIHRPDPDLKKIGHQLLRQPDSLVLESALDARSPVLGLVEDELGGGDGLSGHENASSTVQVQYALPTRRAHDR